MNMASHWDIQHHLPRANQDFFASNGAQKFTLLVEDFESSAPIEDSPSRTSSISRPSTYRTGSSDSGISSDSRTTTSTGSNKRRLQRHDFNVNSANQRRNESSNKRTKRNASQGVESAQIFACPYSRYDPGRYSASNLQELNYRSCSKCYLTDIARVKQHLYRVHDRSKFYCPTCFQTYETQHALMKHVLARICTTQECPFGDKMTAEQSTVIRKKTRGADPYFTWYDIYATLFPGMPLPLSPYAAFSNPGSENLDAFMYFVQTKLPPRLRSRLRSMGLLKQTEQDSIIDSVEANLINVVKELRREFDQPLQQDPSPIACEVSSVISSAQHHPTAEASMLIEAETPRPSLPPQNVLAQSPISSESLVYQCLDDDNGEIWDFDGTVDDAMNWQQDIDNKESYNSDNLISNLPTELYGPPTTVYKPQANGIAVLEARDYFIDFHRAVTIPY